MFYKTDLLMVWLMIGATVGAGAASARGWKWTHGALVGAPLGVLAIFLFLVDGVRTSSVIQCPHCAERIRRDARVCRHCRGVIVANAPCATCATGIPAGSKFCRACGRSDQTPARA